jgi:uncharacterized protein YktB (UPF0637 family)
MKVVKGKTEMSNITKEQNTEFNKFCDSYNTCLNCPLNTDKYSSNDEGCYHNYFDMKRRETSKKEVFEITVKIVLKDINHHEDKDFLSQIEKSLDYVNNRCPDSNVLHYDSIEIQKVDHEIF